MSIKNGRLGVHGNREGEQILNRSEQMLRNKREDPASLATGKGTDGSVSMATEKANRS
jgi:hypothetical protein